MSAHDILRVENLGKAYNGKPVLEEIGFSVRAGEVVALIGSSGAGKTTLFKLITCLEAPDSGIITFRGTQELNRLSGRALRGARRQIGFVFQQFNLIKRMTALQNVLVGRLGHTPTWRVLLRHFSREDVARAHDALVQVGLGEHVHQRVDRLSGGQQQRVAIARAITQECKFILADEPIASLDPDSAAIVMETLREVAHRQGLGVLCSLHQADLAQTYSDRLIGLKAGRIVLNAPTREIDGPRIEAVYTQMRRRAPDTARAT